jgi:hypothetical protein
VLGPLLERVAQHADRQPAAHTRALVRRIANAWSRGPGGLARFDALLVCCAGQHAAFARLLAEWPPDARPLAGGMRLRRMRVLLAHGRDPREAAVEAERVPVSAVAVGAGGVPVPGR